ncbi:carbon-nitrogen hydrolase family protein [Pedobacter sp. BAL39]|uniref:carbon-nitrogen hydrolase family protein n=1 Tax=Pedobacter sp. BAL39 TaxID=391596 RepID=UPI00015598CA|nr:carbon-nitrogen hydrolase family protein [Pedobacter sp. BAL39]EDM37733.1 carbon-nitrogen hydrolase family protein [Pedobacter sp. BAL39]
MKISIAQINPIAGRISANIEKHISFVTLAAASGAGSVFFPELSLTGYEPRLAKELATHPYDIRFDEFQKLSNAKKITIGVGMPLQVQRGIRISMIVFQPHTGRTVYSKQQLHLDEKPYFKKGTEQVVLNINGLKVVPAICYESLQPSHSRKAHKLGADVYLSSVAKSEAGVNLGMEHYPAIAKKYAMPVLMANSLGDCDDFRSVGKSSIWTRSGDLVSQMDDRNEGLLIFDTETEEVMKK